MKFKARCKKALPGLNIRTYYECESHDWVEMNLEMARKPYPDASTYVSITQLAALSKVLKTQDISVTGYEMGPAWHEIYIIARGVKF